MMSINAQLTVVGFFHEILARPVTITSSSPTIKDALDVFAATSSDVFDYTAVPSPYIKAGTSPGSRRMLVFGITYKGFKLDSVLTSVVGTEERVWQFYVQNAAGVNKGNPTRIPFDQYPLEEGDLVIWRLVTVFKSGAPKRIKQAAVAPQTLANLGKPAEDLVYANAN